MGRGAELWKIQGMLLTAGLIAVFVAEKVTNLLECSQREFLVVASTMTVKNICRMIILKQLIQGNIALYFALTLFPYLCEVRLKFLPHT